MSETPSRLLTPEEAGALDEAAKPLVGAATAEARRIYPEFDGWDQDRQLVTVLAAIVQTIFRPTVHAAEKLNLDSAAFGVGLALGHSFAAAGGQDLAAYMMVVNRGIITGQQATIEAAFAMPTMGTKQ